MRRNVVSWAALVLAAAAFFSSRTMTKPLPAARAIPSEGQKTAKSLSEAFESVADFVKPSVVQISVERKAGSGMSNPRGRNPGPGQRGEVPKEFEDLLRKFFGPDLEVQPQQFGQSSPRSQGTGSGFVYDDKGHILTNNHVVANAGIIRVRFHDGTEAEAKVVGTDKAADVAVIKVLTTKFPAISKGQSSKLRVGEWVMAVGSPFGLSQSVTAGIVSATERSEMAITDYNQLIQTDAAINPGNSGGPLVDMDGRVVGINTAIVTGSSSNAGVGFAIPIDFAAGVADKIIKDGKVHYARIGVRVGPLSPTLARQFGIKAETKGLLVEFVAPGSPADKAGLKNGDVITSFNHAPATSVASFRMTVAMSDIGRSFDIGYVRGGKERQASVTLASAELVDAQESGGPGAGGAPEPATSEQIGFGLSVQELNSDLASRLGYAQDTKGLIVTDVKEGSVAEGAGIEKGDVITQVVKNRVPTDLTSVKQFDELVGKAEDVALFVKSPKGSGRFVGLSKSGN